MKTAKNIYYIYVCIYAQNTSGKVNKKLINMAISVEENWMSEG